MDVGINHFLSMLTLAFSIVSIIAGAFTAYFGSGKSRGIGGILIVLGIIVFVVFLWGAGVLEEPLGKPGEGSPFFFVEIWKAIVSIIGAIVGAAIAIGVFLLAIMKS